MMAPSGPASKDLHMAKALYTGRPTQTVNINVLADTKHTDNVSVWIYFSAITVQSNINYI